MAECAYCKSETDLYVNNVAVCVKCSEDSNDGRQMKATLYRDLQEATKRADEASNAFLASTTDGLPSPDGAQQIHNASHKLTDARNEMMKAHHRLNDYIEHGIVPDDLKRVRDSAPCGILPTRVSL